MQATQRRHNKEVHYLSLSHSFKNPSTCTSSNGTESLHTKSKFPEASGIMTAIVMMSINVPVFLQYTLNVQ